jgi:hypothetical protein
MPGADFFRGQARAFCDVFKGQVLLQGIFGDGKLRFFPAFFPSLFLRPLHS